MLFNDYWDQVIAVVVFLYILRYVSHFWGNFLGILGFFTLYNTDDCVCILKYS
ncbi:hypothetical protein FC48_GL000099 [Ligilactobacillus murinus DSM 20452 = NBRC 14221]|uniref:Uncharacterized protein n=1 Tax=Ligilactobacillus murinus DSM 20452 = NBRC 14221 TaxID=1423772 RepID=A0A0R2B880_9LACO|nr:hypothetical protein FC48_GL000099 [Ligilactobacillus murinus DSM 20452 = NBRC 14221]